MEKGKSARVEDIRKYILEKHSETWPILEALSPADQEKEVYVKSDVTWTVRDIVAHLADSEVGLLGQAKRVAVGKPSLPEDFDLDRWNRGVVRRTADKSYSDLLKQILEAHHGELQFLQEMDEEVLDLRGRHGSGVNFSVEDFLRRIPQHRWEHTQDISEAIG
ncbi:MAG: hypothetical protein GTO18_01000 [Anaerolineales bacterium]|nr:hypothetical protein [Anaerolineales bacterium]